MKGLELPINVIVVVALAVLVLVVISAFFLSNFFGGAGTIDEAAAFTTGCGSLRALGCRPADVNNVCITGYSENAEDKGLGYLCIKRGADDTAKCAKLCGCVVFEAGGALNEKCK